jgi:hypothetical protein
VLAATAAKLTQRPQRETKKDILNEHNGIVIVKRHSLAIIKVIDKYSEWFFRTFV